MGEFDCSLRCKAQDLLFGRRHAEIRNGGHQVGKEWRKKPKAGDDPIFFRNKLQNGIFLLFFAILPIFVFTLAFGKVMLKNNYNNDYRIFR